MGVVTRQPSTQKTFSYVPSPTKKSVLGDIGDITDDENSDGNGNTPDLLGNILRDGNKTGVLSGGVASEFQETLIAERLKLARKKSSLKASESDQCDTVTSSATEKLAVDTASSSIAVAEKSDIVTEKEDVTETVAEKKLRDETLEIEKLEQKRKILESYYNKKLQEKRLSGEGATSNSTSSKSSPSKSSPSKHKSSSRSEGEVSKHSKTRKKRKKETSSESESETES